MQYQLTTIEKTEGDVFTLVKANNQWMIMSAGGQADTEQGQLTMGKKFMVDDILVVTVTKSGKFVIGGPKE